MDDDVDGVRLQLSTAATNGPIIHPPDMCVWRTIVEYLQRKTPDSPTTAFSGNLISRAI
jgi:hypothetical protein